ncbi:TPA: phage tail assembly protein [Escherichia coli]|nr:phage tail assembly protein [Escherichia coli]HBE6753966.1 phage tail assembly protein [Escherichia coli]HBE6854291.1 phage tail assembly protein [Escherichia coli]
MQAAQAAFFLGDAYVGKNSVPASCVEIVLSVPYVTASGQTITHVTMRAPTVRDRLLHRRSTKPEAEADLDMIAGLCGMDAADMMNMEACDYLALERQFNVFLLPPVRRKKKTS